MKYLTCLKVKKKGKPKHIHFSTRLIKGQDEKVQRRVLFAPLRSVFTNDFLFGLVSRSGRFY